MTASRPTAPTLLPDDDANRALVENVHPRGWTNPSPAGRYNLVVVGAGTAGLVTAAGAAGLGARVALVERRLMGGDCLNFGCVPSKAILRVAHVAALVREAGGYGVTVDDPPRIDFGAAMARMRRLRAALSPTDSAARFRGLGVDVYLGDARFVSPDTVAVDGQELRFRRAVIATGSHAATLPVPGLAEAGFLTNETVFSLTELPRRLLIVGAGPIGCELAQAFRRFGSEVAIVSLDPRLLPREDPDAAAILTTCFERERIGLHLGARLLRVETGPEGKVVMFDRGRGEERAAGDVILLAVGRVPELEGFGLDAAGVRHERTGLVVDDRLRTTNRRIYAAGDVCSGFKFTHAADAMARIAIENALFFGRRKMSALVIPWCTYTEPEIAHVGWTAAEARERGHDVATFTVPLAEVDRAVLEGGTEGFARLHLERRRGRILGATLVARHAGETIGEVVLAMTAGLGIDALGRTIHPYPTVADALRRTADAQRRTRLTPGVRRLFERYFRWRR
ncbi:MAG TPA: mercuric reductase [Candidatus Nitrosopolaris sp.]|nr:mercuric reductase [Candidatus Nitrosopolaris sp.]